MAPAVSGHPVSTELPSPEVSLDISSSLRLAVPLSSLLDCWLVGRPAILLHTWSCVCSQETYQLFWKYSLFFLLPIIPGRISASLGLKKIQYQHQLSSQLPCAGDWPYLHTASNEQSHDHCTPWESHSKQPQGWEWELLLGKQTRPLCWFTRSHPTRLYINEDNVS